MTRERWEQILFAHVGDEVVQDMLNQYVLELELSNAKLRELVRDMWPAYCFAQSGYEVYLIDELDSDIRGRVRALGIEVDG